MNLKWEILTTIDKRIISFKEGYRQNLSVLGKDEDEINYLVEKYILNKKDPELIYIHIDPLYHTSHQIFKNTLFMLLSQYLNITVSLDSLIYKTQNFFPSTIEHAKKFLKTKPTKFLETLDLINKFINESGKKCILLIRKFSLLKEIFKDFGSSFSKFLALQNRCMTILFDSYIEKAKKILNDELNLLFGGFEILSLETSSFWSNYSYFNQSLQPQKFNPHFIAFFIQHLKSNLFYYYLFTQKINEIRNSSTLSEKDIIFEAFKDLLFRRESLLFQKFSHKLNILKERYRDYQDLIKILSLLSQGYLRKNDLAFFLKIEQKQLIQKIKRLSEIEYIEVLGNICKISDSLFSFWLSKVFELYLSYNFLDEIQRIKIFKQTIEETFSLFKEEFYREKTKKVLELFSLFKDDILVLKKQRLRFPLLKKVKIITYPEENSNLLIGEGKEIIIVEIKEGACKEKDIYRFIERSSLLKNRNLKRIYIYLGEIEDSVKLIAKKDKIILWGKEELNELLRIYNKPIIL
ncbi:MAG: hypothetical protein B6D56_02155 [Candidatus Omnitrophica bacterium 4484_70.1]|nr:MAG: hypothetical protein B6D56_02155 [Candidatus Omnitrophica bacterium 4484_70.1]